MDPIYLYMVHSEDLSLASQITLAAQPPQGKIILVHHRTPLVLPSWVNPPVRNFQLWRWTVPLLSDNPAHILHLFPLQQPLTKPATAPEAAKPIRSTDDLIKEFPDQFQWHWPISQHEYKIWLHHDAHPMIHAPRKCPIALHLKVKEHLNKMECLGVITHVDEPMDWVSSIYLHPKGKWWAMSMLGSLWPQRGHLAMIITRCQPVEEVAHKFAHSHFFTKLDAHHGY